MNISKYERETVITFNEAENTAGVYTFNKALLRKLEKLAQDRPDECKLEKVSKWGEAADYIVPKAWIKVSPTRIASEAQKAALTKAREIANRPK